MFLFNRPLSAGEFFMSLLAIVGFVLGVIGNITGTARGPTLVVLSAAAGTILLMLVVSLTRKTYVLEGYRNVMTLLERLARTAKQSIWTVRTHHGSGESEQKYFEIIRERIISTDNPLEDFRRVVRVGIQPATVKHLAWLIQAFADQPSVRVKCCQAGGPSFDFMIVDGKTAVIGLPQSGGLDNAAAIVVRGRTAVKGIEAVFDTLFNESQTLFVGNSQITNAEKEDLVTISRRIASAGPEASGSLPLLSNQDGIYRTT
jgi:hypothetical protein